MEAVLAAPDPTSPIGVRDRALMMLLADTGIELSELCRLSLTSAGLEAEELVVGSGRRRRRVPLRTSRGALLRYLSLVRTGVDGEAMFLSSRGGAISERAVQHRVRQCAAAAGVAVTVRDLIALGRARRAGGDAARAAQVLGFARPDAVRRRYAPAEREPEPAAAEEGEPHPFLEALAGEHPGGMPAAPGTRRRPPARQDMVASAGVRRSSRNCASRARRTRSGSRPPG